MKKLLASPRRLWLPSHHSTGDWDFQSISWALDASIYVSSPSSLRCGIDGVTNPWAILCRTADTQVIDQGRIVSWLRVNSGIFGATYPSLVFRAQTALGGASLNNSYRVSFASDVYWYYRSAAGADTLLATIGGVGPANVTWTLYRITWWNGKNLQNQDATVLRLEQYVSGAWVAYSDCYDTNQYNKGSATNRVGLGVNSTTIYTNGWFDDTEIWCPA